MTTTVCLRNQQKPDKNVLYQVNIKPKARVCIDVKKTENKNFDQKILIFVQP